LRLEFNLHHLLLGYGRQVTLQRKRSEDKMKNPGGCASIASLSNGILRQLAVVGPWYSKVVNKRR